MSLNSDFEQCKLWQDIKVLITGEDVSDFFLEENENIVYEVRGRLIRSTLPISHENWILLRQNLLVNKPQTLKDHIDSSLSVETFRFRAILFLYRGGERVVLRKLASTIPKPSELNIPQKLKERALTTKQGLILITGPTGSGKTTTIASLLQERATERPEHIITLEDPIEVVYPPNLRGYFTQREIGVNEPSYEMGLKASLRQAPHVILVGEIRTEETAEIALQASETGHLVISTFHTGGVVQTVQRYLHLIPQSRLGFATAILAEALEVVAVQRLVPIQRGEKRLAIHELMLKNSSTANSIRSINWTGLQQEIDYGFERGQLNFPRSVEMAKQKGLLTREEAENLIHLLSQKG